MGTWTPEQSALWDGLHHRTCMLFSVWRLYKALFGDKTTVDRMNSISGMGFRILQDCMLHEQIRVAMAITDRASTGKNTNLSIERLIQTLPAEAARRINDTLDSIAGSIKVLRQHRNRRLMHFDLETATGSAVLPKLMTDDLEAVVRGIGAAMSDISAACTDAHQAYEHIGIQNAEGAMQWMISDSVRLRKLREHAGKIEINDAVIRELARQRSDRLDDRIMNRPPAAQDGPAQV